MFKVVMASNPEILRSLNPHFTVEAEYGDICVEGSLGRSQQKEKVQFPLSACQE